MPYPKFWLQIILHVITVQNVTGLLGSVQTLHKLLISSAAYLYVLTVQCTQKVAECTLYVLEKKLTPKKLSFFKKIFFLFIVRKNDCKRRLKQWLYAKKLKKLAKVGCNLYWFVKLYPQLQKNTQYFSLFTVVPKTWGKYPNFKLIDAIVPKTLENTQIFQILEEKYPKKFFGVSSTVHRECYFGKWGARLQKIGLEKTLATDFCWIRNLNCIVWVYHYKKVYLNGNAFLKQVWKDRKGTQW